MSSSTTVRPLSDLVNVCEGSSGEEMMRPNYSRSGLKHYEKRKHAVTQPITSQNSTYLCESWHAFVFHAALVEPLGIQSVAEAYGLHFSTHLLRSVASR